MKELIENYILEWERRCYFDGLPDEVPNRIHALKKAPSYKSICVAILNNDHTMKTLGFTPTPSKYYSMLKGIEISARNKQLRLDL